MQVHGIELGNVPWSKERLREIFYMEFFQLFKLLEQHPGYRLHQALQELAFSREIFDKSVNAFFAEIKSFQEKASNNSIWGRRNRAQLEEHINEVRRHFFYVVISARAQVEHCRHVTSACKLKGIGEKLSSIFQPGEREILGGLRNLASHVAPLDATWRTSFSSEEGYQEGFVLRFERYQISGGWNKQALAYIEKHPVLEIQDFVVSYLDSTNEFYSWLLPAARLDGGESLIDYESCIRVARKEGFTTHWNIRLKSANGDQGKLLKRLELGLTASEAKEVLRLPKGSREQVDLILRYHDTENLMSEELRDKTYRALGLS